MPRAGLFLLTISVAFGQNVVIRSIQNAGSGNNSAIVPQMLVSIYGSNLSKGTAAASEIPLPTQLADTVVKFNGIMAPLLYVSPNQINAQVPSEIEGSTSANVVVSTAAGSTDSFAIAVNSGSELGIFTQDGSGCGQGAVLNIHSDGTATLNTPQNSFDPQKDVGFSIFLTGVNATVNTQIGVQVGLFPGINHPSINLTTGYAGPAPGLIGVDQLNALYYPTYYIPTGQLMNPMPEGCRVSLQAQGTSGSDRGSQWVNVSVHSSGGLCQDVPPDSFGVVTWQQSTTSDSNGISTTNSVAAQFLQAAAIGFDHPPLTNVSSDDDYGLLPLPASFCAASYPTTLNAGPISAAGPGLGLISLQAQEHNGLVGYQAALLSGAVRGGQYSIADPIGGSIVGPFAAAAAIPVPITITTDLQPGTTIALPFTLNWTGGGPDSLVTLQLIAHVLGQLALPVLEATTPASVGTKTLAPPPAAVAFKFPLQAEEVEIVVTQVPAQAPSQPFNAPGLTLGGEQAWNYAFDFKGLKIH
jgi:uncharacterized protein (TIGR03437 family)